MKKLVQQLIVILTLAAFAVTLPGCGGGSEEAEPVLPEQGNDEDEDQGGGGDGGDPAGGGNDDGEGEGDSGGGDGEGA